MIDEGGIEHPSGWPGGDRRAWKNLMWGGQGKLKYQPEGGWTGLEVQRPGGRKHWFQSPSVGFQGQPPPIPPTPSFSCLVTLSC